MAGSAKTIDCHGFPLEVPDGWSDESLFRFGLPSKPPADPASPLFRTNLVAAKRTVPPELSVQDALKSMLSSAPPASPETKTFKVRGGHLATKDEAAAQAAPATLGSGLGTLGKLKAAWLETSFWSPDAKRRLYQRQIATIPSPGTMLILTFTSDQNGLETHARQIGFSPSAP